MTELYVIRHGATEYNRENGGSDRIRGWKDVPLSDEGREEAQKLAKKLADSGIVVIFHSDLQRAADTAKAVAKTTGAKLISVHGLRPWNVGKYQGVESNKAHPALEKAALETPDKAIEGGEAFNDFKNRVLDTLKGILATADKKCVAIVTHHRVERLIAAWRREGQPSDRSISPKVMFSNGERTASCELITINPARLGKKKFSVVKDYG